MNIDEQIKIERESIEIAIFPRERREHAEKLAKLMKKKLEISEDILNDSVLIINKELTDEEMDIIYAGYAPLENKKPSEEG